MRIRHRNITIDSDRRLTLHVAEAGPAAAPLIVMLHGFPDCWTSFRKQVAELSDRFHVIMPDQRGYNSSDKPRGVAAYEIPLLVDDVGALVASYGKGPAAAIVGHDWGAAVTWGIGVLRPEITRKLVVVNVPHTAVMRDFLKNDSDQRRRSWYMLFFQLPGIPELMLTRNDYALLEKMLSLGAERGTFTKDDIAIAKQAWSHPRALTSMLNWYRAGMRSVLRGTSREVQPTRVTLPTQIIWGTGDPALKHEMANASAALCDDARIDLIHGAKHWPHVERPDEFNRLLAAFLA